MIKQRPTKTITTAYTVTISDCGITLICNSASAFEVTLPTATGLYNFDLILENIGAGNVSCSGQIIKQYGHAHITNNSGVSWVVAIGGGGLELGETSTTAYRGDRGKTAYEHSQTTHAPSDAQKNSDISKPEIEAKLTGAIMTHTHAGEAPTGGATGQVLKKISDVDRDMEWGDSAAATNGLPTGGTTNQLLAKNSNTNYDGKWVDAPSAANGMPTGGTTGQVLAKTDNTNYNVQWVTPSGGASATVESDWGQL